MRTPMNHQEPSCAAPAALRADIKAYLDKELPLLRRRAVATHLRQCERCRAEAADMERIGNDLKAGAAATPALAPDLRRRLLAQVASDGAAGAPSAAVPTARVLPLWRRQPALVFGSAAVCTTLFAAVFVPLYGKTHALTDVASAPVAAVAPAAPMAAGAAVPVASAVPSLEQMSQEEQVQFQTQARQQDQMVQAEVSAPKRLARLRTLPAPMAPAMPADAATDDGRHVHREASITVAVDRLESASDQVEQMVKATGGYVAENQLATDDGGYKSADLTVKVPVAQFDDTMKQLARLGDVTAKSVSGEDITEKLSDSNQATTVLADEVEASAAKLRAFSGSDRDRRYREAELRQVKIQLAQEKARLGLLRKMARLATIDVSLTEKAKRAATAPPQSGFLADLRETNRAAAAAFSTAVRVPVVLVIWVLAFSPLWVPLIILYRYAALKSLARQAAAAVTAPSAGGSATPAGGGA